MGKMGKMGKIGKMAYGQPAILGNPYRLDHVRSVKILCFKV
jgi:hypothetical protein